MCVCACVLDTYSLDAGDRGKRSGRPLNLTGQRYLIGRCIIIHPTPSHPHHSGGTSSTPINILIPHPPPRLEHRRRLLPRRPRINHARLTNTPHELLREPLDPRHQTLTEDSRTSTRVLPRSHRALIRRRLKRLTTRDLRPPTGRHPRRRSPAESVPAVYLCLPNSHPSALSSCFRDDGGDGVRARCGRRATARTYPPDHRLPPRGDVAAGECLETYL